MTYLGFETVDRLRFFTCPVRESRIYLRQDETGAGQRVKVPKGAVQQLTAVGHFLRRAQNGHGAVLLPVPPRTRILEADYPSLFWHLERQILGPGHPPPEDMSQPTGVHAVRLVTETEVRSRWGVAPEHPLEALYAEEPQYLELDPGLAGGCEFKPVFYLHPPVSAPMGADRPNSLYLPLSIGVPVEEGARTVSQDPDERWCQFRRQSRARGPTVGYQHRVYVVNCGRVRRREDLREDGWQLKAPAVEVEELYSSVSSERLPEEVCIGAVRDFVRLRPTRPRNDDLYL